MDSAGLDDGPLCSNLKKNEPLLCFRVFRLSKEPTHYIHDLVDVVIQMLPRRQHAFLQIQTSKSTANIAMISRRRVLDNKYFCFTSLYSDQDYHQSAESCPISPDMLLLLSFSNAWIIYISSTNLPSSFLSLTTLSPKKPRRPIHVRHKNRR